VAQVWDSEQQVRDSAASVLEPGTTAAQVWRSEQLVRQEQATPEAEANSSVPVCERSLSWRRCVRCLCGDGSSKQLLRLFPENFPSF
jgi:hypothetical protein